MSLTGRRDEDERERRKRIGLCAWCQHARVVRNDRGSEFFLCRLSESDPRFPRYPRLPVVSCAGHLPAQDGEG